MFGRIMSNKAILSYIMIIFCFLIFYFIVDYGFCGTIEDGMYKYFLENCNEKYLMQFDTEALRLIRNEIYARHGKKFFSPDLIEYFSKKEWYKVNPHYDDSLLTEHERQCIILIKKIEDMKEKEIKKPFCPEEIISKISTYNAGKIVKEAQSFAENKSYECAIDLYIIFLDKYPKHPLVDDCIYKIIKISEKLSCSVRFKYPPRKACPLAGDIEEEYLGIEEKYRKKYSIYVESAEGDVWWEYDPTKMCKLLIQKYPDSPYIDQAVFKLIWQDVYNKYGLSIYWPPREKKDIYRILIKKYTKFLEEYPNSILVPKARKELKKWKLEGSKIKIWLTEIYYKNQMIFDFLPIYFDMAPFIKEDIVFVDAISLFENVGYQIKLDRHENILVTYGYGNVIKISLYDNYSKINNEEHTIIPAPIMKEDRLMVPIEFIVKAVEGSIESREDIYGFEYLLGLSFDNMIKREISTGYSEKWISKLKSEYNIPKVAAAISLGRVKDNEAIIPLITALINEGNHHTAMWIGDSLGEIGEEALEPLVKLLTNEDWDIRVSAARGLGKINNPKAIDALIKCLNNDSAWWVRASCIEALGNIGNEKAIPHIKRLLNDKEHFVRFQAEKALQRILNRVK